MRDILLVKGPVVTPRVATKAQHSLTTEEFLQGTQALQQLNLGTLLMLQNKGPKSTRVFVKKPPDEARPILEANQDLCLFDHYVSRYREPVSKMVTFNVRSELVKMGAIAAKLLK